MLTLPDFRYKQIAFHIAGGSREKLKFRADNIVIEDESGKVILQHSCHRLFALFIVGETTLTTPVMRYAVQYGFPIIIMNRNMKVVARINSAAEGNTLLREKQYFLSRETQLEIAKKLIRLKINNQKKLISQLRYLSVTDKEIKEELENCKTDSASDLNELRGIEGYASKLFFSAYFRPLNWIRREPRCKRDISNLLLDIGYTYLFNFLEGMLSLYGFDLYSGVMHSFFYQRKSLVCDLIEPFRCIIDRRLRKAHNLNQISEKDFFFRDHRCNLEWKQQQKYIRLFMKDILEEKEKIFLFCQAYYRWFIKSRSLDSFPEYSINGDLENSDP